MDVPEVQLDDATPLNFWKKYISQRQPVVVHGVPNNWSSFNDDTMLEKAGDAVVMVEHRSGSSDAYGQGRKGPMALKDLITHLQRGDSNLYMSTQEVGVGRDGHPLLYGPPLVDMDDSFPLQQPLLKHLVPQSINMWMGCAPEGSSSGLHHDFHDNLYVLLRGSKRFRLFPPSTAPDMYVRGSIKHIYPNGRIVYDGQGDIQADGSNIHDVNMWRAHNSADKAAAAAAAAAAADAAEADQAEALLEQQLEQMLEEGAQHVDGSLMDDYVDSDAPSSSDADDGDGLKSDTQQQQQQQQQQQHSHKQQRQQAKRNKQAAVPAVSEAPPPSFSQVQLDLPEHELRQRYPRFPGLAIASVVVLQAGDMLYLPAGWFHEVTSYGGPGLDGGHLALNYWYHPPNNLDPGKGGFQQPYTSPYYPTVWAKRRSWLQADTRAWWQHQQQSHGQSQQALATQQKQQKQKQDHESSSARKRRCVKWAGTVGDPGNVYEAFNTRAGTATGSFKVLPNHSGLRDPTASSSEEEEAVFDDEQQHHQLGKEVADGIDALEAYFGEDAEAMQDMLDQFLAERRARLAAASRAQEMQTTRLPRLRGRRHHYTVVVKMEKRRPKPKPQPRQRHKA